MSKTKRFRFMRWTGAVVGALALSAIGIAETSPGAAGTASNNGTVTSAGTGGIAPTYIFPFMGATHESNENLDYFQHYLYRLLYAPGQHAKPTINFALSLAAPPKFTNHNKTVTVTLKPYKWSNGETVTGQDVMLFMNMWHRQRTAFFGWAPGGNSIPTVVASVTVPKPNTVVFQLKHTLNPAFFLNNELGEITPLPMAWTVTSLTAAPGSAGCAKAPWSTTTPHGANATKCKAVYDFLSEQSGFNPTNPKETISAQSTYATNKLWAVVDGPFKLTSYTPTVGFTMVPNPAYSGPNKPHIKKYIDKEYTSTAAMFNAMATGQLDIGILPLTEITVPAKKAGTIGHPPVKGPNNPRLAANYNLEPTPLYGFTYMVYNFKSNGSSGQAGPILSQLYVRQALQHLDDQPLFVKRIDKNYGIQNFTPVPPVTTPFLSKQARTNLYPYSTAAAKKLLASHGWKIVPGGTDTCVRSGTGPGKCGAGIKSGAKLHLTVLYASTPTTLKVMVAAIKGAASTVGIDIGLDVASFDSVIGTSVACPKGCKWEIADWGGWTYTHPMPTGTPLFSTGASSNSGSYSTKKADSLIQRSMTGADATFQTYGNWLQRHLPVGFENSQTRLYEVHKGLTGFAPPSVMDMPTPATFRWR